MAETLTSKTTEFSGGVTGAMGLHSDSTTGYLYPPVDLRATELGGCTTKSFVGANSTNATSLKAAAGQVYGYSIFNIDTAPVYLKFYDDDGAPTVGTDTPKLRYGCGIGETATDGFFAAEWFPQGIPFSSGIGYGLVTGITDSDTTGPTANKTLVNIYYK